jgi:hypothetical protein
VNKKEKPKEFIFGPVVKKFDHKDQSFKAEYLYMALTSEIGHFLVEVSPKFFYEKDSLNDPHKIESKKQTQKDEEKDLIDLPYEEKKDKIQKEVSKILNDPYYNSSIIQRSI